jgi:hypothetical protein
MDLLVPVVVMAALAGAYVVGVSLSDPAIAVRFKARRKRSVSIANVRHGERVKVTGVVSALDPMIRSPVGDEACIGFRLVAVGHYPDRNRNGSPGNRVGPAMYRAVCARFEILDETGKARAEGPFTVALDLEGQWSLPIAPFETPRPLDAPELSGASTFSYREGLLKPGDRVSVIGRAFIDLPPADGSLATGSPPQIVCLRGSADEPIVVVDASDNEARR